MLTAGHCVQNNTGVAVNRHNGNYMGYSSATDQNADAALITESYAPRIWIDGVTSNTSRAVAGATVTERVGDVVCAGGAITGQVCRNQIVELSHVRDGVRMAIACNWEYDVPGRPGDSGAPVYRVDSAGRLWGHGMVKGGVPTLSHCFTYVPTWKMTERTGAVLRTS